MHSYLEAWNTEGMRQDMPNVAAGAAPGVVIGPDKEILFA